MQYVDSTTIQNCNHTAFNKQNELYNHSMIVSKARGNGKLKNTDQQQNGISETGENISSDVVLFHFLLRLKMR